MQDAGNKIGNGFFGGPGGQIFHEQWPPGRKKKINISKINSNLQVWAKEKRGGIPSFRFMAWLLLGRLDLGEIPALVGQAGLAHPMGQAVGAALGAGGDAGVVQLPHAAAALVPALLGYFTLRDCHL